MMDSFKRSLDNYLTSNDREFGDCNPCGDGHEWGEVMVDSAGAYRLCCHCDNELNVTEQGEATTLNQMEQEKKDV